MLFLQKFDILIQQIMRLLLTTIACAGLLMSCGTRTTGNDDNNSDWELVWTEDFDSTALDTTVWSKTDRGTPDWANTQSKDERCFEMRDGKLVLKGIINDDLEADTAHYLTGGVWTKNKKSFEPGRFEIRAKLQGAQGAWPAIWLLPAGSRVWPDDGEIDIMERLNHDSIAFQTVHSHYTYTLDRTQDPVSSVTSPINTDDFNVYGVDMYPDSIVFHINGERTTCYPRINDGADGQFPYYRPQFLLIDMQLGGNWVGPVDPAQLPGEMEVDWVKHYRHK